MARPLRYGIDDAVPEAVSQSACAGEGERDFCIVVGLCGFSSRCHFLKYLQGLERIIETVALGRIGENFFRPIVNRMTGLQNPLG